MRLPQRSRRFVATSPIAPPQALLLQTFELCKRVKVVSRMFSAILWLLSRISQRDGRLV